MKLQCLLYALHGEEMALFFTSKKDKSSLILAWASTIFLSRCQFFPFYKRKEKNSKTNPQNINNGKLPFLNIFKV